MRIGIIGAGGMGQCLAGKFVAQGHRVTMANSRCDATLMKIADAIGASTATTGDLLAENDIIVVSIPVKNIRDLPGDKFAQMPQYKIVIDTGNYYPTLRDGHILPLEKHGIDSRWTQEQLGFPVVKAFNAILATSLTQFPMLPGDPRRIAIPISGDVAQAKETVSELINAIGFDVFDAGAIADSWKHQPGSPIYCRDITRNEITKRIKNLKQSEILLRRSADELLMKLDYPAYLKTLL
jgi:8-hydroxy-5-deazaflavin:NADPH oxidoreductase